MKNNQLLIKQISSLKHLVGLAMLASLILPTIVLADNVKLANKPLVDSTTSDVLPNLMFILDNSGSMNSDYTPDWASSSNPILRNNSNYNTQFYNPSISYSPAVNYAGTSLGTPADWTKVRNDAFYSYSGSLNQGLTNLVNNADYYSFVAGEYCKAQDLTDCAALTLPNATYSFAAPIRWCSSSAAAIALNPAVGLCRAIREGSFTNLRTPSSTAKITFTTSSSTNVSSIKINGKEIMASGTGNTSNTSTMASNVEAQIDACTNNATGNCQINGYSASRSSNVLTIISPYGSASLTLVPVVTKSGSMAATTTAFVTRTPGSLAYVDIVSSDNSYELPGKLVKGSERTDCAGSVCTYNEEMTNYANWWTYYRTRMQGMKSSASLAFKSIDSRYRVGFITINNVSSNYLPIAKYELGATKQKDLWYTKLFSTVPSGTTPLRFALSLVGRIYAGKNPVGSSDPVEYACQQNFALLTTDGYWNETGAGVIRVDGTAIGNLDGDSTPKPLHEGGTASSNTLADVAKYYYDTDLRTSAFGNCTGALGQNVCGEGVGNETILNQRMTTMTLGLGIDGTLFYSSDYKTQATGDFASIKAGTKSWPVPQNNHPTGIDDLWHAAVNANGTYFSARDPKQLTDSLKKALSDIQSKVGAGSAAAASTSKPTTGDNFNYLASYTTVKWTGNLEARTVNLSTFETSEDAIWCVENLAADSCAAPASLVAETVSGSSVFYCKTTSSNAAACDALGGALTGTDCRVEVATSCTGTMASKVGATTDSRVIKFNSGTGLVDFNYGNLLSTQKPFFETAWLSANLSQWNDLTADTAGPPAVTGQRTRAVGTGIVNYLRGQKGLEDSASNAIDNRIFRYRETTLGDITESQPTYVAKPAFLYTDPGYDVFKTAQAGRVGTLYVGANDGMLHAFNAGDGKELWAFVPTPVIPKMWKLADRDYAINHVNLVNGDAAVADVCVSGCSTTSAVWKTVLVAGLSGGGRGYYALDITNPTSPVLLWEYTAKDNANLGYTFGRPAITKLNDGTWVALLTSGYNNGTNDNDGVTLNSPTGNGQGYLYVLNVATGAVIKTFNTGAGSATTPSGLAQINVFTDNPMKNNLATYIYGGDLLGNLWRFDINAASGATPFKLATLAGPGNAPQAITTAPELGLINKQRVVFVGTGKYLEVADLSNTEIQSIYAIKDADLGTSLGNPRGSLVAQTITSSGTSRTVSNVPVDFNTGLGWLIDFPAVDVGERVNIDPLLVSGALLVPTIVPVSTSCSSGGYGWMNYINYKTGSALPTANGVLSEYLYTPAAGFNVVTDANGDRKVTATLIDGTIKTLSPKIPKAGARDTVFPMNPDGTYGRKSIWRELIR